MNIRRDIPLASYTTFHLGGPARLFCEVSTEDELVEAIKFAIHNQLTTFILGKGSNLLISDAGFPGLVIKIDIKGVEFYTDKDKTVLVKAGAGEELDHVIDDAVMRNLQGVETLSAIPGSVGAAPVQNVGAYGSEISDTLVSVRAFDTQTMQFVELDRGACGFSYRDSVFKHAKGRYVITSVTLRLRHGEAPDISYKDLTEYFMRTGNDTPSVKEVRDAVIEIRRAKLPDWTTWGTAGSFFKNPIVSSEKFDVLRRTYPGIPGFPTEDRRVKVSLGWILDNVCNVKGVCKGRVCAYEKQALVLVTQPGATAAEVVDFSRMLIDLVKEKTGIEIEGEVEWVN